MTGLAERLARPEVLALTPFDLSPGAAGPFGAEAVRLDANESPFASTADGALSGDINRYPEPQPGDLKAAFAGLYGVPPEAILLTRGGDDAIDILVRAFCRPAVDSVVVCPPTFSAFAHFARVQGARVVESPLGADFGFDADAVVATARADASPKLVFICTPNNPTGDVVPPEDILRVATALPDSLVIADEAYWEFSDVESLCAEAARRPNLLVLKTLSKAWGLAGARVGCLIGAGDVLAMAARVLPPYPLPSPSIKAALLALSPSRRPLAEERIALLKAERARVAERLASSRHVRTVRVGGGNFLFLQAHDPDDLARRLAQRGVLARFRPNAAAGAVRLTIGTPAENDLALEAFGVPALKAPSRRAEAVRETRETKISVVVDLDRTEPRRIHTGVGFYDHMLEQIAAHAGISLVLRCEGDLEIDAHHTVEDSALAFGAALKQALGTRAGIGRYGFVTPMDEAEAAVSIDLSGRPFCVFEGAFEAERIGDYPTALTAHVFRSLADSLGAAIHVRVTGQDDHHKTEACFKAFGRALRQAVRLEGGAVPSTKGVL